MENIIKKAVEAGYQNHHRAWHEGLGHQSVTCAYAVVCDPLFWQSLGKACGWNRTICMACLTEHKTKNDCDAGFGAEHPEYIYQALQFHEINLTQGFDEAVSWLNNLITK